MEINEKKLKKILKEQRLEYQRYLDILKEDFDSKVKLITEQYESIMGKLETHDKKFASIEKRLNNHETRLVSIEKNIEITKVDIEIMKVDIAFIKNNLKKKVDVEEFEALERRVAILEAKSRVKMLFNKEKD